MIGVAAASGIAGVVLAVAMRVLKHSGQKFTAIIRR
jgi:hypothetical protein